MATKLVAFKKTNHKTEQKEEKVIEEGTIKNLNYTIYERGVIHIFDAHFMFKKDCDLFEQEFDKLQFDHKPPYEYIIQGSGDNDNLVFIKKDKEIKIILRKKSSSIIKKLKTILK